MHSDTAAADSKVNLHDKLRYKRAAGGDPVQ